MILDVVRPSAIGTGEEERRRLSRFVRIATWVAVGFSVALPLIRVYDIALEPESSHRAVYAVIAVACYLPVQIWLVLAATRGTFGSWQRLGLGAMTAVVLAMIPVVGVGWLGILYLPAALVLVGLPRPWSLLLYGALAAMPAPLSFALGQSEWAIYFTTGMLAIVVPLAVGIRLIRAVRELQDARLALAEQAVVSERLRIDGEVRESVGTRLAAIAAQGRKVSEMTGSDPAAAAPELRALVDASRRTLAETRRMVTRYRETSMLTELKTAATLLAAAGIDTRLQLPAEMPDVGDERDLAWLRREVAHLLGETTHPRAVTIAVTPDHDRLRIELLRTVPGAEAPEMAAG